jgi:uracil-DNA glycosylase family 4
MTRNTDPPSPDPASDLASDLAGNQPGGARQDLATLVAGIRTHLEARFRSGAIGVPRASPPAVRPALRAGASALALVKEELGACTRCKLAPSRKQIVFGVGNPDADLVFVGEAPGADEDEQGEPFVGAAGQLLTRMIAAMGFDRGHVYICNVIKCRPPRNRNPEPDEVASCEPFLKKQLGAIRPRLIVALGKFAAQALCRENTPISRLRGNFHSYEGIPVMPTYHPAFLLRTPEAKRQVWQDLQAVLAALGKMGVVPPNPKKS